MKNHTETILLAVTGMSPAILTETVWALAHEEPPVIPNRIIVLTSTQGRNEIVKELFSTSPDFPEPCVWDALRASLEKKGVQISGHLRFGTTGDDIRIFTAPDLKSGRSRELDDIRTPSENEAVANFILEEVRRIVENRDTRLIASIAGGRKTMGALLYACMTIIGRETDRLTHVLVNEPFDDSRLKPKFFFPGQTTRKLASPDGKSASVVDARIDLADVLFVPLRNLFEKERHLRPGSFSTLVERCRERIQTVAAREVQLQVLLSQPEILVNGHKIRLSAAEYVIIRFLADRVKRGEAAIDGYKTAIDFVSQFSRTVLGERKHDNESDWRYNAMKSGSLSSIDDRWITKNMSSLRNKLSEAAGVAASLIPLLPEKKRVSLDLPAKNIKIAG